MRTLAVVILTMTLSGCWREPGAEGPVLDALARPMCDLAAGVVEDGGPKSKRAARNVIAIYDAGALDTRRIKC